mmetsp:Transcript_69305/g.167594  ORF Transcript_69305/g.167594 Transcript_69305/m.167594 type:complete len:457 (+) Transcript_69305:124-1494(+)
MATDSYSFASDPRAVAPKRAPYRTGPAPDETAPPANIMYDARVRRGNTYQAGLSQRGGGDTGGMGVGMGGTGASAGSAGFGGTGMGGTGRGETMRRTKMRPAKPSIYDVKPPTREHVEVDVTPFLVEQVPETTVGEMTTQTDLFRRRPDTPDYVPKKTGVDVSTQISAHDNLFNFDREVEPILEVIVSKTLEQSLLEVSEEGELANIELRKQDLQEGKRREAAALRKMEEAEQEKYLAKEKARKIEVERVRQENVVREKVAALAAGRNLAAVVARAAMDSLEREGRFRDPVRDAVEADFMPWLYGEVALHTEKVGDAAALADDVIAAAVARAAELHEARRKADAAAAAEAERRRKEEEERAGVLRVFVKGVVGEDGQPRVVGPIQLTKYDTIDQVEAKIKAWLAKEMGDDYTPPEDGFMRLGVDGRAVAKTDTLMGAGVADNGAVELLPNAADEDA